MQNAADQANASGQTADGVDARAGAGTAAGNLQDKASANLPQETKDKAQAATDKANDLQGRTKNYLGTKMPKERREQSIYRLKKMIVEIQGHSDCTYCSLRSVLHGLTTIRSTSNRNSAHPGRGVWWSWQEYLPARCWNREGCAYRYRLDQCRN